MHNENMLNMDEAKVDLVFFWIDSGWEGYHESRSCSMDTYPESYITEHTLVHRDYCCRHRS